MTSAGLGGRAGVGLRGGVAWERRQDWRSALMASPDGLGWPDKPAGLALGAARDESRLMAAGLGWPGTAVGHGVSGPRRGTNTATTGRSPPGGAGGGRGTSEAVASGQGQVFREGGPEEPPARVRQALSAAVSRETDARDVGARDEAQGSGTVRTRGKPAGSAGALRETEAPGG